METYEILAVAGALAWLPHLVSFLKEVFTKPEVSVITEKSVEIGFTTYGPIFNTRLAFSVKNKDITISGIHFHLKHESGNSQSFFWQGVTQELFSFKTPDDEKIPYEKEHNVLAIKLLEKEVEERRIRFQVPKYYEEKEDFERKAFKKQIHTQENGTFEVEEFLHCEEMQDLIQFIKQSFTWKQGKYEVIFQVESYDKFILKENKYEFFLTPIDIEALENNRALIETSYRQLFTPSDDDSTIDLHWNWRYPTLKKST